MEKSWNSKIYHSGEEGPFVYIKIQTPGHSLFSICLCQILLKARVIMSRTGPRSAVSNVSGNRHESDCSSRGREFGLARSHTFMEIDHEIISTVILLPSAESFKKGFCQLQAKVCAGSTG